MPINPILKIGCVVLMIFGALIFFSIKTPGHRSTTGLGLVATVMFTIGLLPILPDIFNLLGLK